MTDLRMPMREKACLNFTKVDETLFAEFEEFTMGAIEAYRSTVMAQRVR